MSKIRAYNTVNPRKMNGVGPDLHHSHEKTSDLAQTAPCLSMTYGLSSFASRLDTAHTVRSISNHGRWPLIFADHPDPQGLGGLNDQTAFKAEHRRWGPDRGDRPNILFCFDEEGDERPSYSPGWMWYQGQVVLDPENEPILDWQEVPLTLSSKTPGYKMEAITRMESRDVCHEDRELIVW